MSKNLTAGALFAGIGGFCLGFEQAGIKTAWAVENDPASVGTYTRNIKNVRIVEKKGKQAATKSLVNKAVETTQADATESQH